MWAYQKNRSCVAVLAVVVAVDVVDAVVVADVVVVVVVVEDGYVDEMFAVFDGVVAVAVAVGWHQ